MKKYLLPIIITLFTLFIVTRYIPLEQLSQIPKQIALKGLLIGFVLYLISYIVVALRWRVLFADSLGGDLQASPFLLLLMTGSHQLYANFFPARTGELSLLYLAKKYLKIESALSMGSLIIARAFDFLALGILAVVFIAWQHHQRTLLHPAAAFFTLSLLCLPVAGILSALIWGKNMALWIDRHAVRYLTGRGLKGLIRLAQFLSRTIKMLRERKPEMFYIKCLGLSLVLMLVRVALLSTFVLFSPHSIPFLAGCLIGLCTLVASTIPLQGFLGLGPFEGGWVLGYVLVGLSPDAGLISAVNAHLLIIIFLIGLGSMSNIILFLYAGEKR
jgi:hypothetical protein